MKNILCLFLCFMGLSQYLLADDLHFSQISSRNGLSQNTVRSIIEDKDGFIWAGTLDGLNRYDGYNIRSYQPQVDNPHSLSDHRIRTLYVDKDGNLWMVTIRGEFSYYDSVTDSIYKEDRNNQPLIYANYVESSQGDIWLWGKYDGVGRINKEGMPHFTLEKIIPRSADKKACNFLMEDSKQLIWVGGEFGLYGIDKNNTVKEYYTTYTFLRGIELNGKVYFATKESVLVIYDTITQRFQEIKHPRNEYFTNLVNYTGKELLLVTQSVQLWVFNTETQQFSESNLGNDPLLITELRDFVDHNKDVWLYGRSGEVIHYNAQKNTFKRLQLVPRHLAGLAGFGQIFVDSTNMVWIITYGQGLYCYNPETEEVLHYTNDSTMPNSLPSNYLMAVAEDRFGNIWLGSEYAGVIRIVKSPGYIRVVRPEANTIIGSTNNVRTICEDFSRNIWVGTKNGSLYVYDSLFTNKRCIGENINPYSLVEDDNRMWVGTKGSGVFIYDKKTFRLMAQFKHQPHNPASLSHDWIFHVMKDSKNRIWVGSFGGGINLVEEHGGNITFKRFIQDEGDKSLVRYLFQDSRGRVWVGSSDGLIRFNPDELIQNPDAYVSYKKDAKVKHSLSSNDIKVIYEDAEHTIWIGTAGGGLNKFVEGTLAEPEHFIAYGMAQGMADNYVLGIQEYDDYLWLSSEKGLTHFRKDGGSIENYQFAQRSFGNIFNEGAFCRTSNGNMLWGNLDGLLVFNPHTFVPNPHVPPVLLTALRVDGVDWNDINESTHRRSITYTDAIKLTYRQNTFTIEFATLNLRNSEENKYTYILENYDKSWCMPTHANAATYKNLPPGKYVFKVKGANADGVWNKEVTSLTIVITPPFWKSTWAYIVYFLLFALALYVAFRLIMKFNRLNNAVEVEKQLTNHKLRFFTNISHEFRTPLTLIQGAVENMREQEELSPSMGKQLNVLSRNAVNLRRLIDQLLEFRKLQNDVLRLDLEETDMVEFAHDIYVGFSELANQKEIRYTFTTTVEALPMFVDRKKVDKILYNLLSNAFKFTPAGGYIDLHLVHDEARQTCLVSVKDSGIGIPKEKQHLLFSRFTQINFSNSGTGVGLSLVKEFVDVHKGKIVYEDNPEGGSLFTVELPASREAYVGENFIASGSDVIREVHAPTATVDDSQVEETPVVDSETLATYQLLIIDDNDDIRNFLADKFRTYLKVDTAVNGKEGLQKAIETNPDLIICDVMMPEMDGFEVTRQLKSDFQTCHIPIILLTAHSSIEHQMEGIESGADAYITKPFSLKFVEKRVIKLIEQREQLKKRFSKEFVIDGTLVQSTDRDKAFFDQIEKILDDNYADCAFTVDRFVELSNARRTLFFKKVKGITGFSPNELIKIKRLKESAVLLRQSDFTISEISYKVGFEDPFYFSKCFKAYFNNTPSKFRSAEEEDE